MFKKLTQEHYRANPTDLEVNDEEEEGLEEPGPGEERDETPPARRGGPDRNAAARRVEQRRQREQQSRQNEERIRRETRDGVMKDLEPHLKIVERLRNAFGTERQTEEGEDLPEPPDPYDPNYKQLMREYLRKYGETVASRAVAQARSGVTQENQQRAWQEREARRTSANDKLVADFFGTDERSVWPEEKRMQLLTYVREEYIPKGPSGEFTQAQLERAERELFRDEVDGRLKAEGQQEIMDHLGAPRTVKRPVKAGKNLTPAQIIARADQLWDNNPNYSNLPFEMLSWRRQETELDRMQREEPQVYNHFVSFLLKAAEEQEE